MKKIILGIIIFINIYLSFTFANSALDQLNSGDPLNPTGVTPTIESSPGFEEAKKDFAETKTQESINKIKNCVELNTNFPGVGKCVSPTDATDVFGGLLGSVMKLVVNITIAVSFIALIAAGIMIATGGFSQSAAGKGKELLKKVILGIALLGLSGLILHVINPNFFKTKISLNIVKKMALEK